MSQIEIRLPKMGESVTEATITNWLKEVGDTIEMDEPLVDKYFSATWWRLW